MQGLNPVHMLCYVNYSDAQGELPRGWNWVDVVKVRVCYAAVCCNNTVIVCVLQKK